MTPLYSNPELVRNARIHLRPGRMIAAAVIAAVASLTMWVAIVRSDVGIIIDGLGGAGAVFALTLNFQVAILVIGGGVYCLLSVHREKELNTFDYQRITRLTSLELSLGKLFGAPILSYFVTLCLMPIALLGAIRGHVSATIVFETYVITLLGAIAFHALALLVSTLLGRAGTVISIFLYLMLVGFTSIDFATTEVHWEVHRLSPFFAGDLLTGQPTRLVFLGWDRLMALGWNDRFLAWPLPHLVVLIVLYATITAWLLLAIWRNLKRNAAAYEVFSPGQAFVFVLYLAVLVVGFFPWTSVFVEGVYKVGDFSVRRTSYPTQTAEQSVLFTCLWLFVVLVLALLRNREKVRRRVRELGNRTSGWWAALWPAPYVVLAVAVVGGAVVWLISHYRSQTEAWDLRLAVYDVAFLAVWLTRDALYLQWMNLRCAKRPLGSAILYLAIFYTCTSIVLGALNLYHTVRSAAFTALLVPSPLFVLGHNWWNEGKHFWIISLALVAAEALFFACLHLMRLREFRLPLPAEAPAGGSFPQHA